MRFSKTGIERERAAVSMAEDEATQVVTETVDEPRSPKFKRARRILIIIIILLLLALCGITFLLGRLAIPRDGVATVEASGGLTWVRSIYGWGETPEDQFSTPRELEVASNGDILVTDSGKNVAFRFTPEGQLREMVGMQTEVFTGYAPIAQGIDGRLFIGEPQRDRIHVFSSDGNEPLGMISFPRPLDIAYHDGRLLVGSLSGFALLDAETGNPEQVFGKRGQADDQFDTVNGVAFDSQGFIYIADLYNNRISKYDPEGNRIWMTETGAPGNVVDVSGSEAMNESLVDETESKLQLPADLCIDRAGRVVVIDAFDFTVALFDGETGEFIAKYGAMGGADGQLLYPSSIAYDEQRDWFVVADTGNQRVQILRIDGSSPGVDVVGAARRTLAGPLRACLIPLLLLIILVIAWVVTRIRRRRRAVVTEHVIVSEQDE